MPPKETAAQELAEALQAYDAACEALEIARVTHDEAYLETVRCFRQLNEEQQDEVQKRYQT